MSSNSGSGSNSGSATFPVTIDVTGKHADLLPGSSATVAITVKQLADVISVPTQAISTVDGKTGVKTLEWKPVRELIEIRTPGQKVRVLERELTESGWTPDGSVQSAQYDAPWVPGPLRRNEVMIPVRRRD